MKDIKQSLVYCFLIKVQLLISVFNFPDYIFLMSSVVFQETILVNNTIIFYILGLFCEIISDNFVECHRDIIFNAKIVVLSNLLTKVNTSLKLLRNFLQICVLISMETHSINCFYIIDLF